MAVNLWSALSRLDHMFEKALVGWSANDIPDLAGKVALVTGGNSGLGYELVRKLAENGAEVYMVSRLAVNGHRVVSTIAAELGEKVARRITVLECNLLTLANVDELSRKFRGLGKPLHLLVLNAAVFHPGPYRQTEDGFEQTLAISYFSHVRLTMNLLDIIISSGPSRIVFTASEAEVYGKLDWDDLQGANYRTSGMMPYANAKLCGLMWAQELQDRLRREGARVDVFAAHPGLSTTPIVNKIDRSYWTAAVSWPGVRYLGVPQKTGATSLLYVSTEPALKGKGFRYVGPLYFLWPFFHTHHFTPYNPTFSKWEWRRRVYEATVDILRKAAGPPLAPSSGAANALNNL